MNPNPATLSLMTSVFIPLVTAGSDYVLTLYRESNCEKVDGDENSFIDWHTFDSSSHSCQGGTMIPADDWERNSAGQYKAYVQGSGLDKECKLGLLSQAEVEPDKCGNVMATIDGAQSHNCAEVHLDESFGTIYCCSSECDNWGLNAKRAHARDLVMGELSSRNEEHARHQNTHKRDDSCKWNSKGGGKQKKRSAQAQKITGDQPCDQSEGCHLEADMTVSWEATETFGISSEIGASFFEIVSASMTLSYEYSYTHGGSKTSHYSTDQPSGVTGHLVWYQYFWCDDGYFSGKCDEDQVSAQANSGQSGSVCIPAQLESGNPDGTITFVASL